MGFFTVNKKQLSAVHSSNSSVSSKGSNTTKTSRSSSVSYKPTHSTKKNVSSNGRAQASSKGPGKSANIKAVECFLDNMNNFTTVDNFLIPFTSRDTPIKPEDFPAIRMETFAQIMEGIHKSFPDVYFQYKNISESPDDPNMVLVDGFFCTATHTGELYAFAPGVPAIPAKGIAVKNDEENFYFTMKDGKIDAVELLAFGSLTGPAGLYEQIGGDPLLAKQN